MTRFRLGVGGLRVHEVYTKIPEHAKTSASRSQITPGGPISKVEGYLDNALIK